MQSGGFTVILETSPTAVALIEFVRRRGSCVDLGLGQDMMDGKVRLLAHGETYFSATFGLRKACAEAWHWRNRGPATRRAL